MNLMFGLPETPGLDRAARPSVAARGVARFVAPRAPVLPPFPDRRAADGGALAPAMAVARVAAVVLLAVVGGHVVVGLRLRSDLRRLQPQGGRSQARRRSKPTTRRSRAEAAQLRTRNSQLESELAMTARHAGDAARSRSLELIGRERAGEGGACRSCRTSLSTRASRGACRSARLVVEPRGRRRLALQRAGSPRRQHRTTSSRARSRCRPAVQPAVAGRAAADRRS